jgi:hypothetical protein
VRILVCGGRNYSDYLTLSSALDQYRNIDGLHIIHGAARGADTLAWRYAVKNNLGWSSFPADWKLGPRAGPLRNQQMLDEGRPDVVLAFPGGRGTADMVSRAQKAGIKVRFIGE